MIKALVTHLDMYHTRVQVGQPPLWLRLAVRLMQAVFLSFYLLLYMCSPKVCTMSRNDPDCATVPIARCRNT